MKKIFLVTALLCVSACDYSYSMGKKEPAPEIDRWRIVAVNDRTFLLDTVTGKNWRWIVILDEGSSRTPKPILGWAWEPTDVFATDEEYFQYTRAIQLNAELSRTPKKQ